MKYLWNIFILHFIGAMGLAFIAYTSSLIMGCEIDRSLVGASWIVVSIISFIFGIMFTSCEHKFLFEDEMRKLYKR